MKKLVSIFAVLTLFVGNANAWYIVGDEVKSSWGNPSVSPSFIQDANGDTGSFRLREGWACCNASNNTGNMSTYGRPTVKDDAAIMAFVAQKMVANGGYFCLTQIHVASGSGSIWTLYQQPAWPRLQCAWFCEPGFEGENCAAKTSEDAACDATEYTVSNITNTGNDQILQSGWRPNVEDIMPLLFSNYQFGHYEHDIVLGAIEFNMHAIVAQPIALGAVGDHPAISWLTTQKATGGKPKQLCAQGFSKSGCEMSSKNCGKDVWCTGYDKYNESIHNKIIIGGCNQYRCKDDGTALSDTHACTKCTNNAKGGIDAKTGKCVVCETGKYLDSDTGTCKDAAKYAKQIMQFGKGTAATSAEEQCWSKESPQEYIDCIKK